jgi:peptidoglycan/LPS O-acetylase OafA/YrhL
MFGCCLAVWNNPVLDKGKCYRPTATHVGLALLVLALCLVVRNEVFRQTIRYTLQGAALYVVFAAALTQRGDGIVNSVLCSRPLWVIGLLSYTIYLSHETAFTLVEQHLGHLSMLAQDAIVGLIVAAYATLMFWLVEKPLARIRRQFSRSRKAASPRAAPLVNGGAAMHADAFLVSAAAVKRPFT